MSQSTRVKPKPDLCTKKLEELRAEYLSVLREPIPMRLQKLIDEMRAAEAETLVQS